MDREISRVLRRLKMQLATRGVRVKRFVIFGSCALTTKRREESDVDVVAISDDFARLDTFERFELIGLACADANITTPMDILPVTEKEYEEAPKGTLIYDEVKPKGVEVTP